MHSYSSELQAIQRYHYSTYFQFTVPHALGFLVFSSRILAMDLSKSHCNFNSHMKSCCQSLIPFLPFLQLPIPKTRLDYSRLLFYTPSRLLTVPSYNSSARIPRKTPSSIVKNACLLVRYLPMDVLLLSCALVLRECVYRPVAEQWVYTSHIFNLT
jgi:hypothetical protein